MVENWLHHFSSSSHHHDLLSLCSSLSPSLCLRGQYLGVAQPSLVKILPRKMWIFRERRKRQQTEEKTREASLCEREKLSVLWSECYTLVIAVCCVYVIAVYTSLPVTARHEGREKTAFHFQIHREITTEADWNIYQSIRFSFSPSLFSFLPQNFAIKH